MSSIVLGMNMRQCGNNLQLTSFSFVIHKEQQCSSTADSKMLLEIIEIGPNNLRSLIFLLSALSFCYVKDSNRKERVEGNMEG